MRRGLVILLAASLAAAMVPHSRVQRAVYTEEEPKPVSEEISTKTPVYCQHQTPCEWRIYHSSTQVLQETIQNTYCECVRDHECLYSEEDTSASAVVAIYRCRPPPGDATTTEVSYSTLS